MDATDEKRARLCAEHALVTGPDGGCVLCRREQSRQATRRAGLAFALLASLTSLGLGAVVVRRSWPGAPAAAVPAGDVSATGLQAEPAQEKTGTSRPASAVAAARPTGTGNRAPVAASTTSAAEDAETEARQRAIDARALEAARQHVQVTVYTTTWCPHCKRAKRWLTERNIPFQELDVERNEANKRRLREINPSGSIPTFDIEGETLRGFSESSVAAARERAARKKVARM